MTARCWFCGEPCEAHAAVTPPQCTDAAACFARSVAPPGAPSAHPAGRGACPEDEPCDECAAAYAEADADARDNEEESETTQ